MIRLASIINQFEREFINAFSGRMLPSQLNALHALKNCRSDTSPLFKLSCSTCHKDQFMPHSCGHRSCPHCQHHESQQWIEQQRQKHVPVGYFMITFTLPQELRSLAWRHQKIMYQLLFQCAWDTLATFSAQDKKLKGTPGVVAVLHTHSRQLNYHPHVHAVMPAAVIDKKQNVWRKKDDKYLFNHKALAKVFRAKILAGLTSLNLEKPKYYPKRWVVDVQSVGSGDKALIYLGRYLYRGVIQEKDILSVNDGKVTFRYLESKTKRYKVITLSGIQFLWRVLQHVLPKGFRRARNYGFLHPNSKNIIGMLRLILKYNPLKWRPKKKIRKSITCRCCGAVMRIVKTRFKRIAITLAPT